MGVVLVDMQTPIVHAHTTAVLPSNQSLPTTLHSTHVVGDFKETGQCQGPCAKDSSSLGARRRLRQDATSITQQGAGGLDRTRHCSETAVVASRRHIGPITERYDVIYNTGRKGVTY